MQGLQGNYIYALMEFAVDDNCATLLQLFSDIIDLVSQADILFTVFGTLLQDEVFEQVVERIRIKLLPGDYHGFIFGHGNGDIVFV